MATLEDAIAAFGQRHSYPPEKARQEAERLIAVAVEAALRGPARFDLLPYELEPFARQEYERRVQAGEGDPNVQRFVGSTGARWP
jgi:hypothetical protein